MCGNRTIRRTEALPIEGTSRIVRYLGIPKVTEGPGRNLDLDALRGLAIILVVLGHAITYTQPDFRLAVFTPMNLLAAFIYTFHVPLFCFVSGFVIFGRKISPRDKFLRLALPFLAWIPVSYLIDCYAIKVRPHMRDMLQMALRGQLGLWYLWFLFLCCLAVIPVRWLERRGRYAGEAGLALLTVLFVFLPLNFRGVPDLRNWFLFFALGYVAAKHRNVLKRWPAKRVHALLRASALAFIVLFLVLFQRITHFYYVSGVRDILSDPQQYLGHLTMGVLGIAASVYLVRALRRGYIYRGLCWFGLVSIDIYVAQAIMLKLGQGTAWGMVGTAFAAGVFLSLALSFLVLRRSRLLGAVFLGLEWSRPYTVGAWLRSRFAPEGFTLSWRLPAGLSYPGLQDMRFARVAATTFRRLNRQEP